MTVEKRLICSTKTANESSIRGDAHMTSTLGWVGGWEGDEMLSDVGGGGLASVLDVQKENWICAMTRHHAEPNIIDKKYYGQEIFILTLTSDSEPVLY